LSQENVEIVKRCMKFWEDRDPSLANELLDPNVEIDLSRNVFNPAVYRGISGFEQMVSVVDDAWDDFRADAYEFVDAGNQVVAALTVEGKGPGSGIEVSMQLFQVWTLRYSKVVRIVGGYRDRRGALEAAGLSGQDAQTDSS
jgi:ketosteroid isomerase-like protein